MKVLSIDFDYFQNVDAETLVTCYPDGIDLPTETTLLTWCTYYCNSRTKEKLEKVTIKRKELCELKRIIKQQAKRCPVLVMNSHKHIYNFIKSNMAQHSNEKLWITNIDMHHDMFSENIDLDCGNWISHIKKEYENTSLEWIAPRNALKMYDIDTEEFRKVIKNSIADMRYKEYDIIFLCRSDNWLPPHLDNEFHKLLKVITKHFDIVRIEESVAEPRKYQEAVKEVKELFYREIEKGNLKAESEVGE